MYKSILVPVDGRERSKRSIGLACRMAATFDSHLVGLYVQSPPNVPAAARLVGAGKMLEDLQRKVIAELAESARKRFEKGVNAAGPVRTEWRTTEGERAEVIALHARYADLVIVNQTDPGAVGASNFVDAVILSVGRPMLVVPFAGEFTEVGRNVVLCWDASREAARALTDALPLLVRAAKVTILTVDASASRMGHGELPGADIALYLARHGVKAEVARITADNGGIGEAILSRAFDLGTDLIVMGAYGHSRVRQVVLGGVTRTILRSMTVPVLLSH
jgi:nucleotide-binding universal stress UspA family protein